MGIPDDHRCQRTGSGRSSQSTCRTGVGTRQRGSRFRCACLESVLQEIEKRLNYSSSRGLAKLDILAPVMSAVQERKGRRATLIWKEKLCRTFLRATTSAASLQG